MATENDVKRAARDAVIGVVDVLKTRIANEVLSGTVSVTDADLGKILQLFDSHGQAAVVGALRSFYDTFDSYIAHIPK